jgi:transposase
MARKNRNEEANINEEEITMTENTEMNDEVMDEMEGAELNTNDVPANEAKEDGRIWKCADGSECSKSAFIREQFSKFNKGRKEISAEYNIPYRTVYGATVNMENEAEPTNRGRGVTFSKINVTEDGAVVFVKDGIVYINGEVQPEGTEAPETMEMDRNEYIKQQVLAGVGRGDIAKRLDLSYGVIYGITKEAEGTRQKYEVTLEDGTVISRSEYIRKQVEAGVAKSDIAKELGVEYSVVWQATKKLKTTEEKFVDTVKSLEKFLDQVEMPEVLRELIDKLGSVKIKAEEADTVSTDGETNA